MYVSDFEGCCGARIICDFMGDYEQEEYKSKESFKQEMVLDLKNKLKLMKRQGVMVVFATLMTDQKVAIEILTEFGFYTTKPFGDRSGFHGRRKCTAWFLPLDEYNPLVKES